MKRKFIPILCSVLLLAGCGASSDTSDNTENTEEETSVINKGDYAALLPFKASDARSKHASMSTSQLETSAISNGLMEMSKEHFSPGEYAFKESEFLTFDVLDANDGSGLLGRTSGDNPNGMNPERETSFTLKDGGTRAIEATDVLLLDIYELDWYKNKELGGISIAVVLNNKVGSAEKPDTISDEMMRVYGEDVGTKVVNYLRTTHPEVGNDLPIYVTLFMSNTVNDTLPGSFIEDAFYKNKSGSYESVLDEWALFPSTQANTFDQTTAGYFDIFNNDVRKFFPEDTSVIGRGHFTNGNLKTLRIDIVLNAKTGAEIYAAIQQINGKLSVFSSTSYQIVVDISNVQEHVATISRSSGSSTTNVTILSGS